ARLEEAVQAYRAALEERTRDRVPLDWAATQNNLGNALRNLGEREIGAARLEESVVAYRAALEERTRDRVPLNWAGTSYILGYTEALLGERLGDIGQVDEGLSRIKSAIPVLEAGGHDLWAGYAHNVLADAAAIRDRMAGATG
nr:hypothetical protein [Paracoccaceae bacterium]